MKASIKGTPKCKNNNGKGVRELERMNTKRTTEYILVATVNVLFAFYTFIFLNGVPYISLHIVTITTYFAVCGWLLYGCFLYMILKWDNTNIYGRVRHILVSVAIGFLAVLAKAILDYFSGVLIPSSYSLMKATVIGGTVDGIFGGSFIILLFLKFEKGKKQWSERAQKPARWILADVCVYIAGIIVTAYATSRVSEVIEKSDENLLKMDIYFARGFILPLNVWTYTFFAIIVWWFMRTLYIHEGVEEITKGNITDKKFDKRTE